MKNIEVSLLKGIGIISVVIGHAWVAPGPFVGVYHLPVFFFVAGLTYNCIKYEKNFSLLLGNRLSSFMGPYMIYMCFMLMLHNFMFNLGVFPEGTSLYGAHDFVQRFFGFLSLAVEPLNGALWFIGPWMFAVILYGLIVTACALIFPNKSFKENQILIMIICAIMGVIALWISVNEYLDNYKLASGLLLIPLVAVGGLYQVYNSFFRKYINWIGCLLSVVFIVVSYKQTGVSISINGNSIVSPVLCYPLILSGIYACLYISKVLRSSGRLKIICKFVALCGDYSLDIMIMHFVAFKLFDYIYIQFVDPSKGNLSDYPVSIPAYGLIYFMIGIALPILCRLTFNKVMKWIFSLKHARL